MAKKRQAIDFTDIEEFRFDAPVPAEDSKLVITSNAEKLKGKIQAIVDRYKGTELTESNVDYVKTLKSHFVSLRTGIERERKEWSKIYIDPMKKTVDSVCKELQAIVAEGETALADQLEAYDQKRKDALTVILNGYKEEAVRNYSLRAEYAERIVLKDKYYNKTQDEGDTITDIEEQASALAKEQQEYDAAVALIKDECEGSTLIPETYIEQLKYRSCTELVMKIKADKKKNLELLEKLKEKEEAGEGYVLGEDTEGTPFIKNEEREQDKPEMSERVIRIRYPASLNREVSTLFTELRKLGVSWEFVK